MWYKVEEELPKDEETVLGAWQEVKDEWSYEVVIFFVSATSSDYHFDSQNDPGLYPPVSHWKYLDIPI